MNLIKKLIKKIIKKMVTILLYILRIFPIQDNKILFSAFSARAYGDNPKYIAEYILKNKLNYKCVFVLNKYDDTIPDGIKVVKYNTLAYLYELVTSKFWIDNTRKQSFVVKRKKQVYIQTWHGSIILKKIEKEAEDLLDKEYVETAKKDSKNIDYLLVSNSKGEEYFKKYFWYNGKIEITGSPRVDVLIENSKELKENVLNKLNIDKKKKILLYAPTFRNNCSNEPYKINFSMLSDTLNKKFGGEWLILARLHPNISNLNLFDDNEIINVSNYPDISELYIISDVLITDYSSTMFDFSVMKKPVLLYCSDINDYVDERDFTMDLFSLPFKISQNNDELRNNVLDFNLEEYIKRVDEFYKDMNLLEDGNACRRVIEIINRER